MGYSLRQVVLRWKWAFTIAVLVFSAAAAAQVTETKIKLENGTKVTTRVFKRNGGQKGWTLVATTKKNGVSVSCKCDGADSVTKVCSALATTTACLCDSSPVAVK